MIRIKINLTALKHGLVKAPSGNDTMICIPVKANKLFLSEKNNVYLDIVGFEYTPKDPEKDKNTHLLKQSLLKEDREKMTEEEQKAIPILGNAQVMDGKRDEPAPNSVTPDEVANAVDDLPF